MHSFTFSKASQARFEHHGKDKRKRGDIYRVTVPCRVSPALEIYVSNEGRSVRVWDPVTKRELK